MPDLYLVISDAPLCSAVVEQLSNMSLGTVREEVRLKSALAAERAVGILFDESAADTKNLKDLSDYDGARRMPIVLLGKFPETIRADYVTEVFAKPLRLGHLLARLQFYIDIAPRLRSNPFTFGPYRFEPQNRQVVLIENGSIMRLTEKETALLECLGQNEQSVTREALLATVWGYDARIDTHTLETHIYQLRRKLDPDSHGEFLINDGGGYKLRREGYV